MSNGIWVTTANWLPDKDGYVLVAYRSSGEATMAYHRDGKWYDHHGFMPHELHAPKYWTPLPKPPSDES